MINENVFQTKGINELITKIYNSVSCIDQLIEELGFSKKQIESISPNEYYEIQECFKNIIKHYLEPKLSDRFYVVVENFYSLKNRPKLTHQQIASYNNVSSSRIVSMHKKVLRQLRSQEAQLYIALELRSSVSSAISELPKIREPKFLTDLQKVILGPDNKNEYNNVISASIVPTKTSINKKDHKPEIDNSQNMPTGQQQVQPEKIKNQALIDEKRKEFRPYENKKYYSQRYNLQNAENLDLANLLKLFKDLFLQYEDKGFFQEAFGYYCNEKGRISGNVGVEIDANIFLHLRKKNLWPITYYYFNYTKDDLFDIIEYLFNLVSKPVEGRVHEDYGCGTHYYKFDKTSGQNEFSENINKILNVFENGYELSKEGDIREIPNEGLKAIINSQLPIYDTENINNRVEIAIKKFLNFRSTLLEKKDAVRDLADVLEYIRPKAKIFISCQDDNDLFNLANNFGIRHHNENQKDDYDQAIWYDWMFYYYLATIYACVGFIIKQ